MSRATKSQELPNLCTWIRIGWLRHNRSQLPWDSDGDLGILEAAPCLDDGLQFRALTFATSPSALGGNN